MSNGIQYSKNAYSQLYFLHEGEAPTRGSAIALVVVDLSKLDTELVTFTNLQCPYCFLSCMSIVELSALTVFPNGSYSDNLNDPSPNSFF